MEPLFSISQWCLDPRPDLSVKKNLEEIFVLAPPRAPLSDDLDLVIGLGCSYGQAGEGRWWQTAGGGGGDDRTSRES